MPPETEKPDATLAGRTPAAPKVRRAAEAAPHGGHAAGHLVRYGNLELNILAGQARDGSRDLLLAPKEFALLYLLIQRLGEVVPQSELYEAVWNQPLTANNLALKSSVSRLRRKLSGHGYRIAPVRGAGYRLEELAENVPGNADEG